MARTLRGMMIGIVLASALRMERASAEATASDAAAAQALFDDAKQLIADGQASAACPKLEESYRLDPALGTRYQLGRCYELTGRTASAWSIYLEVAAEAHHLKQEERAAFAREEADRLKPQLSYLTLHVSAAARVPGLVVLRNEIEVGEGQWGARVPVDPGGYVLKATAAGYLPWETQIEIAAAGEALTATVPALRPAPVAASPAKPDAGERQSVVSDSTGWSQREWWGAATASVGVVGLGVSGWLTLEARQRGQKSDCDPGCSTQDDLDANEEARRWGTAATWVGLGSLALVGAGATLFLTAESTSVRAVATPQGTGFQVAGRF